MLRNNRLMVLLLFPLTFFLCGVLHIYCNLNSDMEYTLSLMQIVYSVLVIHWGFSIDKRIADKRIRRLLLLVVFFMIMYFVLQMSKYTLFYYNMTARRYLWYAYYIPMILIPLILFLTSLYMNLPDGKSINRLWYLLLAIAVLFIIGFLTNDLHNLAFSHPSGVVIDDGKEIRHLLFYAFVIFEAALVLAFISITMHKCRLAGLKKYIWLPALPLGFGSIYTILYCTGIKIAYRGEAFWEVGEAFAFTMIGMVEACIQIGLIPSNTGYDKLFDLAPISAVIKDFSGNIIKKTNSVSNDLIYDEHKDIYKADITGGSVSWQVDLTELDRLNTELSETNKQIESRNEYLSTQNSLKEELAAVETRNDIYDKIAKIVSHQLELISKLLSKNTTKEQLAEITVYNAYIKRRGNLELLRSKYERLPVSEVVTAVAESIEYIKLTGVDCSVIALGDGEMSLENQIAVYERFESVIEAILPELKRMLVTIKTSENGLSLRMRYNSGTNADAIIKSESFGDSVIKTNVLQDDEDYILSIEVRKEAEQI